MIIGGSDEKSSPGIFWLFISLAGGNLIADTWPVLSHLLSLTGLVLWLFFLILHLLIGLKPSEN